MVIRHGARGVIALAALALAGAVVLPAPAAHAAPPEILVSTDGVTFMPAMTVDVFDDLDLMVPGDTIAGELWVRNDSPTSALVRVAVTDLVVSSPVFGSAVTLSSSLNGVTYASLIGALSNCQVVVQGQTLTAGGTVRVDLEVSMSSATSGTAAQGDTADLGFIVTAHDSAAGPFPDANGCSTAASGGSGGTGTVPLALTGSDVLTTFVLALGLLGIGTLFATLLRRRREDETRQS